MSWGSPSTSPSSTDPLRRRSRCLRLTRTREPFATQAPAFFAYLRQERGLRDRCVRVAKELSGWSAYGFEAVSPQAPRRGDLGPLGDRQIVGRNLTSPSRRANSVAEILVPMLRIPHSSAHSANTRAIDNHAPGRDQRIKLVLSDDRDDSPARGELREIFTGEDLARASAPRPMGERRADMYVSTLHDIIAGLGGTLEIRAVFPEGPVRIDQFSKLRHLPGTRLGLLRRSSAKK